MNFLEFKQEFTESPVHSVREIYRHYPEFDARRLYEWKNKGYIRGVINGYFMFRDTVLSDTILFKTANIIYPHSYISIESALSFHGLIPEQVYLISSVSTRKTKNFYTDIGNFQYRTIQQGYFFGYDIISSGNITFYMACPEKAIIDFFYLHSEIEDPDDVSSLRINPVLFSEIVNTDKLMQYASFINNKRVIKCSEILIEEVANAFN